MVASRNQGNSVNGRKSSSSASSSQKPCADTLVTSAAEVLCPSSADVMLLYLYEGLDCPKLAVVKAKILRQFCARLKPELRLPVRALDMDMQPPLLPRKEVNRYPSSRKIVGLMVHAPAAAVGAQRWSSAAAQEERSDARDVGWNELLGVIASCLWAPRKGTQRSREEPANDGAQWSDDTRYRYTRPPSRVAAGARHEMLWRPQ